MHPIGHLFRFSPLIQKEPIIFQLPIHIKGQPSSIEATNEMLKDKLFSTHLFGGQISLFTIVSNFIYLWITSTACRSKVGKIS